MKINFFGKINPIKRQSFDMRGFTLIEVVVAIAVFSIISVAAVGAFSAMFSSYKSARNLNENLKNSQYAMNLMNKTFRTSTVVNPSSEGESTFLEVYDYSQNKCFRYSFSGGKLLRSSAALNPTSTIECGSFVSDGEMTSGLVTGSFYVVPSEGGVYTNLAGDAIGPKSVKVGKITTAMKISNGSGSQMREVNLQSTVSLRDYSLSNIGIDMEIPL
ncbi:MAG: prepilin-type N-terminal cleavage/methylation domain-containing protein [Candidatus Moranbacteria bacterium]|jgi:prepilin-type N-terminal cleavage/methylation domain-containing protein|nr:prepilin-type N-terminal cleavage/methylation domain-containing protein [Candidatus Moranbacteria bacterium]NCA94172.1 prepilin-type N-terminal cleavage/methylation domain-containing protein [Sphingobacteriia bacterium]